MGHKSLLLAAVAMDSGSSGGGSKGFQKSLKGIVAGNVTMNLNDVFYEHVRGTT